MKIALLDLNHITKGIHTNTVPLGLGMLSVYLRKSVEYNFDIKMFKNPESCLKVFDTWQPDVIGLAQYSWNSNLNLHFAHYVKDKKPNCLIIAGGPDLDESFKLREEYLLENKVVDICVGYDGEIPFSGIIKRLIDGESVTDIKSKPEPGTYSIDSTSNKLVFSMEEIPRLKSLDDFGSMYADGTFDDMLDDGCHPFLQTHRGCPFTCSFCHTSDKYYSKMLFQSPDIFRKDMDYLGNRFEGQHNVTLYLSNTNMSLFKKDFEIAYIIKETQQKYDWPRLINVNSGKDPEKLIKMLSIIDYRPTISLQSLTPGVLQNIRRKNISLEKFVDFQNKVTNITGEQSSTELILCLPGETKDSFLGTLREVMNSNINNIVIYTLMKLKGTPLSSEENSQKFEYVVRHRIVPRQFSLVHGKKVLDTEEVIVGTRDMPYVDYIDLRGICFSISVFFNSFELIPIKKYLFESNIDITQWMLNIHNKLSMYPDIYTLYKDFIKETEDELFSTREELVCFFDDPKNYEALCSGELGDNLIRKYKCLVLSDHFKSIIDISINEARELLEDSINYDDVNVMLSDIKAFLNTREVAHYFSEQFVIKKQSISLSYDVNGWLINNETNSNLENFKGTYKYDVAVSDQAKMRFKKIQEMNKDLELSMQMLFRDGFIRDFWPVWELVHSE